MEPVKPAISPDPGEGGGVPYADFRATPTQPDHPVPPGLRGLRGGFLLVALIAAGLAGNYFRFPIFFGADFIFGSIFAMLALQLFGLGWGVAAAFLTSSILFLGWGHHYALLIMTAEVAVVGWLQGRRKLGLVQADALYWLCLGMPLVYFSYHLVMKVPQSNALFIMAKDMMNGIANILVARLLFTLVSLRSGHSLPSFREGLYNLLALFVVCPTLTLLAIESRTDLRETERRIRTTLIQESRRLTDRMETWVVNRTSAMVNLAAMASTRTPQQMQPFLEAAVKSDVNFQRLGLHDVEATITAFYPVLDDLGQSPIGKNFANRSHIPILKQTLRPMLSKVLPDRLGAPKTMVLMLAPVAVDGAYGGYVSGKLSLKQIQEHLDKSTNINAALYTLLDERQNVIMTNQPEQTVLAPWGRGAGTLQRFGDGTSQWVPTLPPNTPATERWTKSYYVAESHICKLAEWKLVLEQPVAPFQKALFDQYSKDLAVLLLLLILALVAAEIVSRQMTLSLEELEAITEDFPSKLATGSPAIHWPESRLQESHQLIANFKLMALTLAEQFQQVQKTNDSLEQRVAERTQALQQSEEKFRTVADYTYDWERWDDPDGAILYCSPSCQRLTGYPPEAFLADPSLLEQMIHPEDLGQWHAHYASVHDATQHGEAVGETASSLDFRVLHRNGEVRWLAHVCYPILAADGRSLGRRISNRDITERKQAEELLRSERGRLAGIIRGTHAGTWEWNVQTGEAIFNECWAGILGYTLEELAPVSIATWRQFAHPDDLKVSEEMLEKHFRGELDYYECESRMKHKDGHWAWVLDRGKVDAWTEDGKPLLMLGTHLDITKRKQIETKLFLLTHELEQKNQEMEDTLYAASHDLRSPLLNVRGFSDSLTRAFEQIYARTRCEDVPVAVRADLELLLAEQIPTSLQFIQAGGQKLDTLISGLLVVSRAGRQELRLGAVDMLVLLGQVLSTLAFQMQESGATVELGELPPCLGDTAALNQVFTNLLDNALKYRHPDRPPHIRISGWEEGDRCRYCVEDNGLGIDPRHQERIWKLFNRLNPGGAVQGEGLGLTLVHRILNRLQGQAWVESNVEPEAASGCRFYVELPAIGAKA